MMEALPVADMFDRDLTPDLRAHTTPDPTDPSQPPPRPGPDPDDVPAPARAPVEEPRAPQPPIKAD
ncbi:hypothetical protein AB595_18725 [Massilia sp. WF1]|uniref:hypothetical protein n=1 Tax=unclassified Massilia TaxID=2609279 RepID=UPI0006495D51|nr:MULTISPECIES: hypothetical protein [unclassified Massilia]ALK96636.1 hypothetical protein AM586_10500 [Massilia sp. WG5]KLU35362.1 hypothetical protein AB595_18725 [Massilia sp. WF1]